ncbi:MAG: pyrroloquinoline quinone biosynthesis protein PqqB [Myxococcales bacterium]|nr:pyrroloquinoline quinone biosynthesis protein PqqB [Myxococcales bacterium]
MQICVLGSAAGGGFPQWNCNCENCQGVRSGRLRAQSRTQSSIAVSEDGEHWLLINASPDILTQLAACPQLQPRHGLRGTPIVGVLLMDAQIDHVAGLMMLREGCPLDLYLTQEVNEALNNHLPLLRVLEHWNGGFDTQLIPDASTSFGVDALPNLVFQRVPLTSNAPPYSPRRHRPAPGDSIGLFVTDRRSQRSVLYAPGLGEPLAQTMSFMAQADVIMVDGTFWTDDEMGKTGLGHRTARSMGHLPVSGEGGILSLLRPLKAERKVLIHINNTNPILDEDSPARKEVKNQGIEVAFDGMMIEV